MRKVIIGLCILLTTACTSTSDTSVSLQKPRYGHAVVAADSQIFVIDGYDRRKRLGSVETFDVNSLQTQTLKAELAPRRYVTAVNDNQGHIYVMGGVSQHKTQGEICNPLVEIINIKSGEILYGPPMPTPRRGASAVYLDGKIYVIGGSELYGTPKSNYGASNRVEILDIQTQTWSKGASMPTGLETRAVVHDGQIYTIGGYNFVSAVPSFYRYDPAQNQWFDMPNLPTRLSAESAVVVGNKLITLGDYNDLDKVLSYDFATQQWQQPDVSMQGSRHQGAVLVGDNIYLMGGTRSGRESLNDIQIFPVSSFEQAESAID
ncbi:Kelch repeat-containing protein [Neptunicella marina]|uniref:Galactose oxidase n=1 Tax=Neptunicella marina TaxID=2125989 RepID=A0A8J6M0J2_9ALTE|nr:kelch repeat-containing protein [Neptunicella marina]MBC3767405.1 hypothetical protein [Neptunicella marina]